MTPAIPEAASAPVIVYRVHRHDRIAIGDADYVPESSNKLGHVLLRVGPERLTEMFTHARFYELLHSGQLVVYPGWYSREKATLRSIVGTLNLGDLPEEQQREIEFLQQLCDEFLVLEEKKKVSRSNASLEKNLPLIAAGIVAERKKLLGLRSDSKVKFDFKIPSPTQMRRRLRRYVDCGMDPMAFYDNRHRGNCGKYERFDKATDALIAEHVDQYASSKQPTKVSLYTAYEDAVDAANAERAAAGKKPLKKIGQRCFEKRIARLNPLFVCAGREGEEAARLKFALVNRGLDVTRPLERVEIDEWDVTLHTFLEKAGIWDGMPPEVKAAVERSRVWVTVAVDRTTKCVLALRFSESAPSAESAIAALEMAMCEKAHLAIEAGAETPWDMHGSLETVATDTGAGFVSLAFKAAARDCRIGYIHPPAKLPFLRAGIERIFGTFRSQLTVYFPGQSFANLMVKGKYDAEGNACLNIHELNLIFIRYVVDVYHNSPHEGLNGETPRNAWLRLSALYPVLPPPSLEQRRGAFGLNLDRQINNRGIRVLGLHYQSPALQHLRAEVGQKSVHVRVDRYDLGAIAVQVGEDWMSVPCTFPEVAGASYWEWVAAGDSMARRNAVTSALPKAVARRALADIRGIAEMATARAELGTPVLTREEFERIEDKVFLSFAFADDQAGDDEDLLGGGPIIDATPDLPAASPDTAATATKPTSASPYLGGDEFGSPEDWFTKE
jgi:putative transposase